MSTTLHTIGRTHVVLEHVSGFSTDPKAVHPKKWEEICTVLVVYTRGGEIRIEFDSKKECDSAALDLYTALHGVHCTESEGQV